MEAFKVLNSGFFSSFQDVGRYGYEKFGVSNSGVGDYFSFKLGNMLLGNNENSACIEIIYGGLKLQSKSEFWMTITGGNLQPRINNIPIEMWQTIKIKESDILSFSTPKEGFKSYLCVEGGFHIKKILNSFSTHSKFDFGFVKLQKDQLINFHKNNIKLPFRTLKRKIYYEQNNTNKIRIILGPDSKMFGKNELNKMISRDFIVSHRLDRVGMVLDGPKIKTKNNKFDIISDGTSKGTIQVPLDGKLYILLNDCQVTGGYPRIGSVSSIDFSTINQLKPGDKIRFEFVTVSEAQVLFKEKAEETFKDNMFEPKNKLNLNFSSLGNPHNVKVYQDDIRKYVLVDGKPVKLEF